MKKIKIDEAYRQKPPSASLPFAENQSKTMRTVLAAIIGLIALKLSNSLSKDVAQWAVKEFEELEKNRSRISFRGADRRISSPFISGDGFRAYCQHICEDHNRCRMDPESVKNGEAIFVKTDFFDFFAKDVTPRINASYIIVSHNGDLSVPDGQDDAPRIGMSKYVTSNILMEHYRTGKLIAHYGQNTWWKNNTLESRPPYLHCLPIGFENRQYPIGKSIHVYAEALQKFVINRNETAADKKPLLLIAFYPKSRVPDRHKVLSILRVFPPKGQSKPENPFYNYTDLSHMEWLEAIGHHKFVLAPFGHGLDTHRISEILLMGGIPVMRRSTISSCYDDSDYEVRGMKRGSLPIVLVDNWEDVTKERLDMEWERIQKTPPSQWDWSRLFLPHWLQRIFGSATPPVRQNAVA